VQAHLRVARAECLHDFGQKVGAQAFRREQADVSAANRKQATAEKYLRIAGMGRIGTTAPREEIGRKSADLNRLRPLVGVETNR